MDTWIMILAAIVATIVGIKEIVRDLLRLWNWKNRQQKHIEQKKTARRNTSTEECTCVKNNRSI